VLLALVLSVLSYGLHSAKPEIFAHTLGSDLMSKCLVQSNGVGRWNYDVVAIVSVYLLAYCLVTAPLIGERSIAMSVSVCLCLCVCLSVIIFSELHVRCSQNFFVHITYGRGSVLLWQRSDMLCTSGFMDDVIFAHNPRLLAVAAQLKCSAHSALGLAINCAQ